MQSSFKLPIYAIADNFGIIEYLSLCSFQNIADMMTFFACISVDQMIQSVRSFIEKWVTPIIC